LNANIRQFDIEITSTASDFEDVFGSVYLERETGVITNGECYSMDGEDLRKNFIDGAGIYTVKITDDIGCSSTKDIQFVDHTISGTRYNNLVGPYADYLITPYLDPLFSDYYGLIGTWMCRSCEFIPVESFPWAGCNYGEYDQILFDYRQISNENPCRGGGTLSYRPVTTSPGGFPIFGASIDITIPPNTQSSAYQSASMENCACLFPAGTISTLPPSMTREYFVGDDGFINLPVYVEFPCILEEEDETPPDVAQCDYDLELGLECDNCALVASSTVECAFDVVCFDNDQTTVLLEGIEDNTVSLACIRRLAGGNFQVVIPCASSPCDESNLQIISDVSASSADLLEVFGTFPGLTFCSTCLDEVGFQEGGNENNLVVIDSETESSSGEKTLSVLVSSEKRFVLFPNPSRRDLNLRFFKENFTTPIIPVSIRINDSYGNVYHIKELDRNVDSITSINSVNYPDGIYWVTILFDDGTTETEKWVKIN
jgi:hypothetical protein